MVALVLALSLLGQAAPPPLAVLQAKEGTIVGERGQPLAPGAIISAGERIHAGPCAIAELAMLPSGRVRIFAESDLRFEQANGLHVLRLLSGRAWLQLSGKTPVAFHMGSNRLRVWPGSSVLVENTLSGGPQLSVRSGRVWLSTPTHADWIEIKGGYSLALRSGQSPGQPQKGGQALVALLAEEAHDRLAGALPLVEFAIELSRSGLWEAPLGRCPILARELSSAALATQEEGLRPPPFFATEVPPDGPNLAIEVEFED